MGERLTSLPRVIPEAPDRPERSPADYSEMQVVTREIAMGSGWSPARAERIAQLFDGLAPEWHNIGGGPERAAPLDDALERGGVAQSGTCLEIGSGVGLWTGRLARHFGSVVAIDIAAEMLARAPREYGAATVALARADGAALPFRDGAFTAVVCVNAFLFPDEYARVLGDSGVVVFASTGGDKTPIYLPPDDVVAALPGDWAGVTSEAGWGTWTVARKARGPDR